MLASGAFWVHNIHIVNCVKIYQQNPISNQVLLEQSSHVYDSCFFLLQSFCCCFPPPPPTFLDVSYPLNKVLAFWPVLMIN